MPTSIPIPVFVDCDETSLKVKVVKAQGNGPKDSFPPAGYTLALQCKEPEADWNAAKTVQVDEENTFNGEDIVDLEPGNPYFVRFALTNTADGSVEYGPETVFDTKPVDCTPKTEKKCVIS